MDSKKIIGCAEVIMSVDISYLDLWPWLCSLQVDKEYRGQNLGSLLISRIKNDVAKLGFDNVYLFTDFDGYYEKFGFSYIGDGYHPGGRCSRVYEFSFNDDRR
jgi:N-acetylglutamate synthase-like GNAT family acetyltransferase